MKIILTENITLRNFKLNYFLLKTEYLTKFKQNQDSNY